MSFDSLSQIVTLPVITQCAAVDLFFSQAGGDVLVSIGPLDESGLPSGTWSEKSARGSNRSTGPA